MTRIDLLAALLLTGCLPAQNAGWATPAPPDLADPGLVPAPTDQAVRVVSVTGVPGPAVDFGGGLAVAIGHGVRWLGPEGERVDVATPGWARDVLPVAADVLWVADDFDGIAVLRGGGADLRHVASWKAGQVRSLRRAGEHVLASVRQGALILLEVGNDGTPHELDRLVLDGRPDALSTFGERWAVGLWEGGWASGTSAAGRLVVTDRGNAVQGREVLAMAGRPIVAHGAPNISGGGLPGLVEVPEAVTATLRVGETLLLGLGGAGLQRFLADGSTGPVRQRSSASVVALTGSAAAALVSWSDGLVERISPDGAVAERWQAATPGRVERVSGEWSAMNLPGDSAILRGPGGVEHRFDAPIEGLLETPDGVLVAAALRGLVEIAGSTRRTLVDGHAADIARDGESVFVAEEAEALVEVTAGEVLIRRPWSGTGPSAVAVTPDWIVGAEYFDSIIDFWPRAGGPRRSWMLTGTPVAVEPVGERFVIGFAYGRIGVASPHAAVGTIVPEYIVPGARQAWRDTGHLCPAEGGAVVALGRFGVARIHLDEHGVPAFQRVDTPGDARDCSRLGPDRWLVADSSGLVEVSIPRR